MWVNKQIKESREDVDFITAQNIRQNDNRHESIQEAQISLRHCASAAHYSGR